jgi:hypothetical protein
MTKKRAIISYEKLEIEQKKGILKEYPDGYINHLTQIKTPTGEILDALIWETEEIIYLVKFSKLNKAIVVDDNDDEDDDDIVDEIDEKDIKEEEESEEEEEDGDSYEKPEEDGNDEED